MADVDQVELERLALGYPPSRSDHEEVIIAIAKELIRHRSAVAADRERVIQVVREQITKQRKIFEHGYHTTVHEMDDAIAIRSADQLAGAAP
jgi:hypothetical protein